MLLKLWAKKEAFMRSDEGATAIEYGLIAAGIAVAISVVVFAVGDDLVALFTNVDTQLQAAAE
ncbi:MAG: Flp family type IVb pilin [Pseudomonadota bacterium]